MGAGGRDDAAAFILPDVPVPFYTEATMPTDKPEKRVEISSEGASGRDSNSSSVMPMLIAGLILIVVGAIGVMMFV